MKSYPPLRMTQIEFDDLLEYSCSIPTGTTVGKRWKCLKGAYDREFIRRGGKPYWIVGEYYDIGDPNNVGIHWYRPLVAGPPVVALVSEVA